MILETRKEGLWGSAKMGGLDFECTIDSEKLEEH